MFKHSVIVEKLLSNIKVISNPNNKPVTILGGSEELRCIGVGTDAAVFQYVNEPEYAYKLFAEDKKWKIPLEAKVYEELKGSPFFSICYLATDSYLVLSYESGKTLYDCILDGTPIPAQVIDDVEAAISYARERNLNPRDIHLKNIFLENGRAKLIDVSEYVNEGNDYRWEHLKKAYDEFYELIKGKQVPQMMLDWIQSEYNERQYDSMDQFIGDLHSLKVLLKPQLNVQST
ncbi:serine/threonine protein kinase [Metabacillus malikii]|uniref:Serine/threonine protein kinase n=1 Tax=Metabacillus malikii TaxID=1504265 RepID=A0ABT9ZHU1_9BACI|nr:serine/threonine protein kinase [Metabacillus malikii]MDQ0231848.1 hypothetical protein [Metabacillus malikii]